MSSFQPVGEELLTEEQLQRMERNRLEARHRRELRLLRERQSLISTNDVSFSPTNSKSFGIPANQPHQNHECSIPKQKVIVSAILISNSRFALTFIYRDALTEVCKSLPAAFFDRATRRWTIALRDYNIAEFRFKAVSTLEVVWEGLPDSVKIIFKDEIADQHIRTCDTVNDTDLSKIDSTLIDKLFPYQKIGVMFGIRKQGRALLADDMGLGKTVQSLGITRYYRFEWPLLIVCPSSVKYAWNTQIQQFLPAIKPVDVYLLEKGADPLPCRRNCDTIVIVSYDQMTTRCKNLIDFGFHVIIFDESHMIKDVKAKRTKSAFELAKKAHRVLLLSGTPALSRPCELFNQLRVLSPRMFGDFRKFALRYCDGREGRFAFEAKGATNMEELTAVLCKTVMLRRLKKDVLDQLPAKRRTVVYLADGTTIDAKMALLKSSKDLCFNATDRKSKEHRLMEYYADTGSAKASMVAKHVINEFFFDGCEPRKVLIFAHHAVVMDVIAAELAKKNLHYMRIDGSTPCKMREEECRRFQTTDQVMVALLSITATGVGITLTAASVVVFAELHWNPGTLVQAEDRAHRIGQKDSVQIQYLLARNTVDDHIWPLIEKKLSVLLSVKLCDESFGNVNSRDSNIGQPKLTEFFAQMADSEAPADQSVPKRPKIDRYC